MSEIVLMEPRHSLALAALHIRYLTTPFHGMSGQRLLAAYYRSIAFGKGAIGYVCEEHGQVLGYVCGVWELNELRGMLFKTQWPTLSLWCAACVFINPQILLSFGKRLGWGTEKNTHYQFREYELRPIVVDAAFRASGIASLLAQRLILDAEIRGFDRMCVLSETENKRAQAFYLKMGFRATGTFYNNDRPVVRYERLLRTPNER